MRTGQWNGKVKFEDFVTGKLDDISKASEETNRLLRKLAGEDEIIVKNKSILDKVIDVGGDILDNGRRDHSNVKKPSRKDRK